MRKKRQTLYLPDRLSEDIAAYRQKLLEELSLPMSANDTILSLLRRGLNDWARSQPRRPA